MLLKTIGGGILCGGVVALGALMLAGRTDDHLVEIIFTTVAAYGSFLLADHFGLSGVLATITAGLVMGNYGALSAISERGKEAVHAFWEYAAFIANSLIRGPSEFLGDLAFGGDGNCIGNAGQSSSDLSMLFRILALLASRHPETSHVLFWGGLRGALALALALGLPPEVPLREEIIAISLAVVAFSACAQGLTIALFLRRMGDIPH